MKRTKEELNKHVEELKKHFGNAATIRPSITELIKFFGKDYNDVFVEGTKLYIDLTLFMTAGQDRKEWQKRFNNNPWQPATITYSRGEVMFFTWDNYPKYKEEWIVKDGGTMNAWAKNTYLSTVKYSDIFAKKIERLEKKNPDELYIQTHILTIDNIDGKIEVINDLCE